MTSPDRRAAAAALVLAAAVPLLAACGTTAGTLGTAGASGTGTVAAAASPAAATLTTIDGKKITVPGGKPAAVFFFSVGCGACGPGVQSLAQAARGMGTKATFLAVDLDPSESPQAIGEFLTGNHAAALPAAIDQGASLSRAYQVAALSTLVVIDPAGTVTYRAVDPTAEKITAALQGAGAA